MTHLTTQGAPADYAATVVAEQIEKLRWIANDVDNHYAPNGKSSKLKFKDRTAYLAIRERVASKIVDFATELNRLRTGTAEKEQALCEPEGNISWDPDG